MAINPGTARLKALAATPQTPAPGYLILYFKTDNVLYVQGSDGVEHAVGTVNDITQLHGDVTAVGPGNVPATVVQVGGKLAAEIAQSVTDTQAATALDTINTIVKRDASGNVFVTQINGVVVEAHASRHLPAGADPLATAAPTSDLTANTTNATGTANSLARSDHSHAIDTGVVSTQSPDQSNAAGTSPNLAKADHIHSIPTDVPVTQTPDQANAKGTSTSFARADHVHDVPTDVPVDVGTANAQGSAAKFARADHVHKGVRSIHSDSNPQRFGDLSLQSGAGVSVTDDGSGNYSLSTTGGSSELIVTYPGSGLSLNYTTGKVIFNGTETFIAAGSVVVPASTTNGYVYVDIDATVKASASLPPNRVPLAIFNSGLSSVAFLEDARVLLVKNQVWAGNTDIQSLDSTTSTGSGSSEKYTRADHTHAIASGVVVTQNPDQSNAAGTSPNFAKADHVHNIPTDVPVTLTPDQSNAQGVSTKFARADHVHNVPTDVPVTLTPDQSNAQGVSTKFARADHAHDIPTGVASGLDSTSTNTQGAAAAFARQDHTHHIASGVPVTQTPDQANAAGTSPNFAKADHVHDIPTAAPSSDLTANTTNSQGTSTSFARADHSHAIDTGVVVTQNTDQANAAGTSPNLARADHIHDIPTDVPVSQSTDQTNTQGTSVKFAKADHIHNIPTDVPVQVGTSNAQGASSKFSKADHVHAVTWGIIGGLIISTYTIGSNLAIAATDSLVTALGKLQAQINSIVTSAITGLTGDVTASGPGNVAATIAVGAVTDTKASLSNKPAITVVATTNQILSGVPTIDGQLTVAGTSIVLLSAQTTASQNGPWIVQSGAWTRPTWYPSGGTTQAFQFITMLVRLGTIYQGSEWRQTAAGPITIDTTATTWVVTPRAGNFRSDYTFGPQTGASAVTIAFANAFKAILSWNPTANFTITMPPTLPAAGQTLVANDNAGTLGWSNPSVNIDGGAANSVYTASQAINGGTP